MMGKIPMSLGAIALGSVIGGSVMAGFAGSQKGTSNGLKLSEVSIATGVTGATAAVGATMVGLGKKGGDAAIIGALILGVASMVGVGGLAYGAFNKVQPRNSIDDGGGFMDEPYEEERQADPIIHDSGLRYLEAPGRGL